MHDDQRPATDIRCQRRGGLGVKLGVPGTGFATRIGGDGTLLGYGTSNVRPDVERYSTMAHVSYDLSDRLSWFGEVAYSTSDALGTPANGGLGPTAMVVQADNAFLSPAARAALLANGGNGTGVLARIFMPDVINARNTTNETTRFVTGLEGELSSEWNWDIYYQHGKNKNHQRLFNDMVGNLASTNNVPARQHRLTALGARLRSRSGRSKPNRVPRDDPRRSDVRRERRRLRAAGIVRQR